MQKQSQPARKRRAKADENVTDGETPGSPSTPEGTNNDSDASVISPPLSPGSTSCTQQFPPVIDVKVGNVNDSAESAKEARTQGTNRKAEEVEHATAQIKPQNVEDAQKLIDAKMRQ